jgi:hypothetical protein
MARLGELLVAARLLEAEQVERALRAQVMWGARLGTNLVELGYIDLDALSRALGRQHDLPAALARHFEKADAELQRRLDPAHADVWSIVPLLRVAGGKIAIAAMDPLPGPARAQIAAALGVRPNELVVSIAAEQRVRYQLERVYGISRAARFLRTKGQSTAQFPMLGEVPVPVDSDPEISIEVEVEVAPAVVIARSDEGAIPEEIPHWHEPNMPAADELAALIDDAIAATTVAPRAGEPSGRDRRHYIKTLGDEAAPATALGRIAIRKVQSGSGPIPVVERSGVGHSLEQATRAIRRSTNRDRVAELVMDALDELAPACAAAMLMIVRGEVAIGWKHFSRTGSVPPELAVPIGQPGLVASSVAHNSTERLAADDLEAIDLLLLRSLGREDGELVIVPVPIAGQVMCMLAIAVEDGAPVAVVEAIAGAASAAFARLVRDASR